jgi:ABC-type lipoprotein release transport system permease subunit
MALGAKAADIFRLVLSILTLVAVTLIAAAIAASLIPARRASTTDPMSALRHD